MKIELTARQIAIIGAALGRCAGWDDPRELERFVSIAAEHVQDGWTDSEMDDILETLSQQYKEPAHA